MNALYSLYDALVSINVPADRARAVVDAMERDMTTLLARKSELVSTQLPLKKDSESQFALLRKEIEASRDKTVVRLGTMMVAVAGLLFTALKLT